MRRRLGIVIAAALVAGSLAPAARAQFGYGQYGWAGWGNSGGGGTPSAEIARGMGAYAAGAGVFNRQTAEATAINTNTWMHLNEYMWQSQQIRQQEYFARKAADQKRNTAALKEMENRLLFRPARADIVSGDALNAVLHQLSNPGIPSSIVKEAASGLTLTPDQVRTVPLKFGSKGVVISAHRLAAEDQWPGTLRQPAFAEDRQAYIDLVAEARAIPEDQPIPEEIIDRGIGILSRMRDKARSTYTGPQFAEAERYLKGQVGLLQMAREPDISQVLGQVRERLKEVDKVELGNAIGFMQLFNLQFGAARSPEEVALYTQTLFPMLAEARDKAAQNMGGQLPDSSRISVAGGSPTQIFHGEDWEQMTGSAAQPPSPGTEPPNN